MCFFKYENKLEEVTKRNLSAYTLIQKQEDKYESIINNTSITVVPSSAFAIFFRKLKSLLTARVELG